MRNRNAQIGILLLVLVMVSLACSAVTESPTATAAPVVVNEATEAPASTTGNCPALPAPELTSSGYVDDVVMAKNTEGEEKIPVGETSVFNPADIFHAVVILNEAPEDTTFTANWFVTDVGPDIACNSSIDSTNVTTSGTRNLDFTLTPDSQWPTGTYRVEIYVNDVLESVEEFSVQ